MSTTGGTPGLGRTYLFDERPVTSIDEYLATDTGGLALARAQELGPDATIAEVTRAGVRGRGGGGFPTGRKWAGVVGQGGTHRYVVANGAEGEPGTFKDRALLRDNPYQVVEGLLVAAFAMGAESAFIACKASFARELEAVTRAVQEMQQAGICEDCTVTIVGGPEEYLFGEEKALLEVIEGNPPLPRLLPPYQHGLFATAPQTGWQATDAQPGHRGQHLSNPTLVNNVETLAHVTHVLARGADWFRTVGTEQSPGTQVCTVVGDVARPLVVEAEMGTPLSAVLGAAGGVPEPRGAVKAVLSGVANPVLTAAHLDAPVSYEGFEEHGSGLGAGGFVAYADDACMVRVARDLSRFLYVESCGQCPPCKLGSGAITEHLEAIEGTRGDDDDVVQMVGWLAKVTDGARCYLAVQERVVIDSILRAFPEEFDEHLDGDACPRPRSLPFPKIVDLDDGVVIYDEHQMQKQPDWTYAAAR